jgi:hypothetical protein
MIYRFEGEGEGEGLDGTHVYHINTRHVACAVGIPVTDPVMKVVIYFVGGEKITISTAGPVYHGLIRCLTEEEGDTPRKRS